VNVDVNAVKIQSYEVEVALKVKEEARTRFGCVLKRAARRKTTARIWALKLLSKSCN